MLSESYHFFKGEKCLFLLFPAAEIHPTLWGKESLQEFWQLMKPLSVSNKSSCDIFMKLTKNCTYATNATFIFYRQALQNSFPWKLPLIHLKNKYQGAMVTITKKWWQNIRTYIRQYCNFAYVVTVDLEECTNFRSFCGPFDNTGG